VPLFLFAIFIIIITTAVTFISSVNLIIPLVNLYSLSLAMHSHSHCWIRAASVWVKSLQIS